MATDFMRGLGREKWGRRKINGFLSPVERQDIKNFLVEKGSYSQFFYLSLILLAISHTCYSVGKFFIVCPGW